MKNRLYVLFYTLAITAFFAGILSILNAALKEKIKINKEVAQHKVIISLLGKDVEKLTDSQIEDIYTSKVNVYEKPLYYSLNSAESADLKVIQIKGQGFWGPVKGYMAVDISEKVIQGIEFTDHSETPGLGGRISEKWFKKQFDGISLDSTAKQESFVKMVNTEPDPKHEFQLITGATETSKSIQTIVNDSLKEYTFLWGDNK
ncbi:MAG: FMN-binding protein [Planctomycetota bacterium]